MQESTDCVDAELEALAEQAFLRKGLPEFWRTAFIEAFQQGFNEGRRQEAKKIVLALVDQKFGFVDPRLRSYIECISDIEELEKKILLTLHITGWEDLLAE